MSKHEFLKRYLQLGGDVREVKLQDSLRVSALSVKEEDLLKRFKQQGALVEKIPWTRFGYWIKSAPFSMGATSEYLRGYYYLQEAAAQLPAYVLDPRPNETVLDMCAAPGGKTTQIAHLMFNTGILVALEKKEHRLVSLKTNLERMRVRNAAVYHMDGRDVKQLGLQFDRILLDAPCSGNYATDPVWFEKRTVKDLELSARIQRDLLSAALEVLKPNGVLVYSTCSLEPEENELNIQWVLDHYKVMIEPARVNIGDPGITKVFGRALDPSIAQCRRFWPHKTQTGGFFIARLRKC